MKKQLKIMVILIIVVFSVPLYAKETSKQSNAGNIGIGVEAGTHAGLILKMWKDSDEAYDFGIGWRTSDGKSDKIYMHADYHIQTMLKGNSTVTLPVYYGIGAKLETGSDSKLGLRIPLGLDWTFGNKKIDMYIEMVPTLNIIPDTRFEGDAAIGIRYYP